LLAHKSGPKKYHFIPNALGALPCSDSAIEMAVGPACHC
jgi:hypothetical protein